MQVFQFDAVTSTMTKAQEISEDCNDFLFCVLAKQQQQGKGTQGRIWESPIGNFYATYCFQNAHAFYLPQIALITGLSVVQILRYHHINICLKWSNDLMVDMKKVGGILCVIHNNTLLIGLGINFKVNPDITDNKCFFQSDYIHKEFDMSYFKFSQLLGKQLLLNLEALYQNGFIEFIDLWQQYAAFYNQKISIELPDGSVKTGIDKGINADGCLLIKTQNGIEYFYSARIISVAS